MSRYASSDRPCFFSGSVLYQWGRFVSQVIEVVTSTTSTLETTSRRRFVRKAGIADMSFLSLEGLVVYVAHVKMNDKFPGGLSKICNEASPLVSE